MSGWMNECHYPAWSIFSIHLSRSAQMPLLAGSLSWYTWWKFTSLLCPCAQHVTATASLAFNLVLTAAVPVVWVFPDIRDQSCPSLYLSLGMVPWTWEALSRHSRNWFLYVAQAILTLTAIPPWNVMWCRNCEKGRAREAPSHSHPCPFMAPLSLKVSYSVTQEASLTQAHVKTQYEVAWPSLTFPFLGGWGCS